MEHSFDVNVACEFGEFAATLIKNFQFWILKNKANEHHFYDGHWWTYNSQKALVALFPYKTRDQIRREIDRLVEREVLIKGNYNEMPTDKTLWYAFKDEEKWLAQNSPMQLANLPNGIGENAKPIPYNKPYIYSSSSSSACAREGKEKLVEWIEGADLKTWTSMQLSRAGIDKPFDDIVTEFYENDFTVREEVERSERTACLKHFQNWLPKYLRSLKDDTSRHKDQPDNCRRPAASYETTLLR